MSDLNEERKIKAYIPDDEEVWVAVDILAEEPKGTYLVEIIDPDSSSYRKKKTINIKQFPYLTALPLQDVDNGAEGVDDMTSLNYLHEASILENLKKRFTSQIPYTYTGNLCIAVNPYKWLPLYTDDIRNRYVNRLRHELKPHVYAISSTAVSGLINFNRNQSIIVSGESGAGKTETVKILMNHIAHITGNARHLTVEKVLLANPLMESFGNAKTSRNDNSSRFGKFTQLQFSDSNSLAGSKCVTYLLEKSRIVNQNLEERNYHVFYQLLNAPSQKKESLQLGGLTCLDFNYMNSGDVITNEIEGVKDGLRFAQTEDTLALLGVTPDALDQMWRLIAGILYLGQVYFIGDVDHAKVDGNFSGKVFCDLVGLTEQDFNQKSTTRIIEVQGQETRVNLSLEQSFDSRDALAKDLYERLFRWLVAIINKSTASGATTLGIKRDRCIALLDIFGFECFAANRFEQLCINFANEKLQQKFTRDVFRTVQEEYQDEGLDWENIQYKDNSETLELLEGKMGVIPLLNEECLIPNGNDSNFISKLSGYWKAHPKFSTPPQASRDIFSVVHFAGCVSYSVLGFVERNRDALASELITLMGSSSMSFIRDCYADPSTPSIISTPSTPATPKRSIAPSSSSRLSAASPKWPVTTPVKKGFMKADTVTTKFRSQLELLIQELSQTIVQYVRCIKPNDHKSSREFDRPMVVSQLRSAGLIEAVRISRAAYPYRLLHSEFVLRFGHLRPRLARRLRELSSQPAEQCRLLLADVWPDQHFLGTNRQLSGIVLTTNKAYELGKTRVYFSTGMLESLEHIRSNMVDTCATIIQKYARGRFMRINYRKILEKIVRLKRRFRSYYLRCRYLRTLSGIFSLQRLIRMFLSKKKLAKLKFVKHAKKFLGLWLATRLIRKRYLLRLQKHKRDIEIINNIDKIREEIERERLARLHIEEHMQSIIAGKIDQENNELKSKNQELMALYLQLQSDRSPQVFSATAEQVNFDSVSLSDSSKELELDQIRQDITEKYNSELEERVQEMRKEFEKEKEEFKYSVERSANRKQSELESEMMTMVEDLEKGHQQEIKRINEELRKSQLRCTTLEDSVGVLESKLKKLNLVKDNSAKEQELRSQLMHVSSELTVLKKRKDDSERLLMESLNRITQDYNQVLDEKIKILSELHTAQDEIARLDSALKDSAEVQAAHNESHAEALADLEEKNLLALTNIKVEIERNRVNYEFETGQKEKALSELRQAHEQLRRQYEEILAAKKDDTLKTPNSPQLPRDRRQGDVYSELVELRAKNDILTKELTALRITKGSTPSLGIAKSDIKEKEQYTAEKRVLLDLLSAQCEEVEAAERAKYEAIRLQQESQRHCDDFHSCVIALLTTCKVSATVIEDVKSLYDKTASKFERWNGEGNEGSEQSDGPVERKRSPRRLHRSSSIRSRRSRSRSLSRGTSRSKSPAAVSSRSRRRSQSRTRSHSRAVRHHDEKSVISSISMHHQPQLSPPQPQSPSRSLLLERNLPLSRVNSSDSTIGVYDMPTGKVDLARPKPNVSVHPGASPTAIANSPIQTARIPPRLSPPNSISSGPRSLQLRSPSLSTPTFKATSPLQHSMQYQPPRRQVPSGQTKSTDSPLISPSRPIPPHLVPQQSSSSGKGTPISPKGASNSPAPRVETSGWHLF